MNKRLLKLAQIAVTFGLLIFVLYQAGLFSDDGQQRFWDMLKGANLPILIAAVLIGIVVNMVSALKWFMLTKSQQLGASYWRIFAYYVIGQFYNMFLPTSVGGDFVRSYELGKFSGRQADSLASVFVERYTGVLVLLGFAAIAVLTQLSRLNVDFVVVSLLVFAVLLAIVGWLVFDQRFYQKVRVWSLSKWPSLNSIFNKISKLLSSVDVYRDQPRAVAWAFLNSIWFYLIAVINVYITALVFDFDVSFIDMLIATPIIMVIMNLPISFGNVGLMEVGYSSVFSLLGYSPALGVAVALLMRLKSFFDGAIGGVLHPIFVTKKHE